MSVFINSDRPGACSGTVLRFSELLQRQCSQLEKVLLIYLFIFFNVRHLSMRIFSCLH